MQRWRLWLTSVVIENAVVSVIQSDRNGAWARGDGVDETSFRATAPQRKWRFSAAGLRWGIVRFIAVMPPHAHQGGKSIQRDCRSHNNVATWSSSRSVGFKLL